MQPTRDLDQRYFPPDFRSYVVVKARLNNIPVLNVDGYLDSSFVDKFIVDKPIRYYLHISNPHGISHIIPVDLQYEIFPVEIKTLDKSEVMKDINFGEVSAETGEKRNYLLYNHNPFKIKYEISCNQSVYISVM